MGYGKPPKHSQFKPGVSGNPKGRKKDKSSFVRFEDVLMAELEKETNIIEHGKKKSVPIIHALAKDIIARLRTH